MKAQLRRGSYNSGRRPNGSNVSKEAWNKEHGGSIPPNRLQEAFDFKLSSENVAALNEEAEPPDHWLELANTDSMSRYHRALRALAELYEDNPEELRLRARQHPARFPLELPRFFISFLTDSPEDLVVDPFAGSNVTGQAAEEADRRWVAFELFLHYLEPSIARFEAYDRREVDWLEEETPLLDALGVDYLDPARAARR